LPGVATFVVVVKLHALRCIHANGTHILSGMGVDKDRGKASKLAGMVMLWLKCNALNLEISRLAMATGGFSTAASSTSGSGYSSVISSGSLNTGYEDMLMSLVDIDDHSGNDDDGQKRNNWQDDQRDEVDYGEEVGRRDSSRGRKHQFDSDRTANSSSSSSNGNNDEHHHRKTPSWLPYDLRVQHADQAYTVAVLGYFLLHGK
jgi:hypothetical protein